MNKHVFYFLIKNLKGLVGPRMKSGERIEKERKGFFIILQTKGWGHVL